MQTRRPLAIMGDGGFWHNGLLSGAASNLLNKGDGVLVVMKNGYTSATGTQDIDLLARTTTRRPTPTAESAVQADRTIENTLRGLGVEWLRTVDNYRVGAVAQGAARRR